MIIRFLKVILFIPHLIGFVVGIILTAILLPITYIFFNKDILDNEAWFYTNYIRRWDNWK